MMRVVVILAIAFSLSMAGSDASAQAEDPEQEEEPALDQPGTLEQVLQERSQDLMRGPLPPVGSPLADAATPELPGHSEIEVAIATEMIEQIDSLNLGDGASVNDLRHRDQLVSVIAGIRDPVVRNELLVRLEERERQSGGTAARP